MKNLYHIVSNGGVFWVKIEELEDLKRLPFKNPSGSFNVLKARLLGLSYGDFLIAVRNNFNATLKGRDGGIIVEFFQKIEDAKKFCSFLNERLNKVLENYEESFS